MCSNDEYFSANEFDKLAGCEVRRKISENYVKFLKVIDICSQENQCMNDSKVHKLLLLILEYLDLLCTFTLQTTMSCSVYEELKVYLGIMEKIAKINGIPNSYIENITVLIWEKVVDPSIKVWFGKELLRNFNNFVHLLDREKRCEISENNKMRLMKLVDLMRGCGDLPYQVVIMETITLMCSLTHISEYAHDFFPFAPHLELAFLKIKLGNFHINLRSFLNILNLNDNKVYSVDCFGLKLGKKSISGPSGGTNSTSSVWLDFNITTNSISIICDRNSIKTLPDTQNSFDNHFDFDILTVPVDEINLVTTGNLIKEGSSIVYGALFCFELQNSCYVMHSNRDETINENSIYAYIENSVQLTHLHKKILPKMFGSKYINKQSCQGTSSQQSSVQLPGKLKVCRTAISRISLSSMKPYKPLKVAVKGRKRTITRSSVSLESTTQDNKISSTLIKKKVNEIDFLNSTVPDDRLKSAELPDDRLENNEVEGMQIGQSQISLIAISSENQMDNSDSFTEIVENNLELVAKANEPATEDCHQTELLEFERTNESVTEYYDQANLLNSVKIVENNLELAVINGKSNRQVTEQCHQTELLNTVKIVENNLELAAINGKTNRTVTEHCHQTDLLKSTDSASINGEENDESKLTSKITVNRKSYISEISDSLKYTERQKSTNFLTKKKALNISRKRLQLNQLLLQKTNLMIEIEQMKLRIRKQVLSMKLKPQLVRSDNILKTIINTETISTVDKNNCLEDITEEKILVNEEFVQNQQAIEKPVSSYLSYAEVQVADVKNDSKIIRIDLKKATDLLQVSVKKRPARRKLVRRKLFTPSTEFYDPFVIETSDMYTGKKIVVEAVVHQEDNDLPLLQKRTEKKIKSIKREETNKTYEAIVSPVNLDAIEVFDPSNNNDLIFEKIEKKRTSIKRTIQQNAKLEETVPSMDEIFDRLLAEPIPKKAKRTDQQESKSLRPSNVDHALTSKTTVSNKTSTLSDIAAHSAWIRENYSSGQTQDNPELIPRLKHHLSSYLEQQSSCLKQQSSCLKQQSSCLKQQSSYLDHLSSCLEQQSSYLMQQSSYLDQQFSNLDHLSSCLDNLGRIEENN